MKREDIKRLFPDAADEQVSALLNIHSGDIGRAKGECERLESRAAELEGQIGAAAEAISALEAAKGRAAELEAEIGRYRQAEADRRAAEDAQGRRAAMQARFDAAAGGRRFLHDLVRKGVMEAFVQAAADKANAGREDGEIFEALTRDKGYFASQNPPVNMGGIGGGDPETDRERFRKMSLFEQFQFASAHPEQAAEFIR